MVRTRRLERRAYDLFLRISLAARVTLRWDRKPSLLPLAKRCDPVTGHSPPTAAMPTPWPGDGMTPVMAELLGRTNGLMAGKGGSMHLTSVERGMMGSYAFIGA
jgi:hypothetical protein